MADDFDRYFKAVKNLLNDLGALTLSKLKSISESLTLRDRKSVIDLAFRDKMLNLLATNSNDNIRILLKMSVASAVADVCSAATPFLLFADLFNTRPISDAELHFSFMEQTITSLKDVSLFSSGRNVLLRMCNDLLRRLSKSQNTVFCGRIQLFLTRLFPLDEKSGLNLMSNFNSEKEIAYSKSPNEKLFHSIVNHTSDEDQTSSNSLGDLTVNAVLYEKFWSLQEYLKSPALCYTKEGWANFITSTNCVIDTFSSIKIADTFDCERRLQRNGTQFTMYLTSEKLLDLQLIDSNFRRYILVQLLIVFQYLTSDVKFKSTTQTLDDNHLRWINLQRESIIKLLGGVSDSELAAGSVSVSPSYAVISHILDREAYWNRWKNESCPSFIRAPEKSNLTPRKRRSNPLIDRSGNKLFRFGNRDLDTLWSQTPDNLEACKDKCRLFRPDLYTHFQPAICELDPAEKVDDEYKSINREEWVWRSLRLLSRRCSYFYTNWNPPGQPIKDYLTVILTEKLHPEEIKNIEAVPKPNSVAVVTATRTVDIPQDPINAPNSSPLVRPINDSRTPRSNKQTPKKQSPRTLRSRSPITKTPTKSPRRKAIPHTRYSVSRDISLEKKSSKNSVTPISPLSDTDGEAEDVEDEEDDLEPDDIAEDDDERGTMEIVN